MLDGVRTVTLGGKARPVAEPPLGKVRRVLKLYRALAREPGDDPAAGQRRLELVRRMLGEFFGRRNLGLISAGEITAFLDAVPDLCGLERATPDDKDVGDAVFGRIYCHLAASFGWSYDDIDQRMTMGRLKDLADYMRRYPPTHQLVAAYMGIDHQTSEEKLRSFFLAAKNSSQTH